MGTFCNGFVIDSGFLSKTSCQPMVEMLYHSASETIEFFYI